MDTYEQKYKKALERAKGIMRGECETTFVYSPTLFGYLFPELIESEDERIRKQLSEFLEDLSKLGKNTNFDKWSKADCANWINWLEKQGEHAELSQSEMTKTSDQDSSRPNGGIVLEDFNGGEGFYKLNLDYLNKKQVEEVEEMVRMWNKVSKESNDNIKSCIGMCLTDADEQRFKDFNTNLKDCLNWLEKQDEQVIDANKMIEQEWSEEDEQEWKELIEFLEYNGLYDSINFLRYKLKRKQNYE